MIQMTVGSIYPEYRMISPCQVSVHFKACMTRYRGMITVMTGSIWAASIPNKKPPLPGTGKRTMAYAAEVPATIQTMVVAELITRLLASDRRKLTAAIG